MIQRREILDTAATLGLRPQVVEKDYVLGWMLAAIYRHAAFATSNTGRQYCSSCLEDRER